MGPIKIEKNRQYFTIAAYAFFTALAVIICYLMLNNLSGVGENFDAFLSVLKPFIWGISLAYVLNPLMVWAERQLKRSEFMVKHGKIKRMVSILFAVAVLFALLAVFFALLIPELNSSITGLAGNIGTYIEKVQLWINNALMDYIERLNLPADTLDVMLAPFVDRLENWTDYITVALPAVFNFLMSAVISIKDILVALIVMIYLLAGKERFLAQSRKLLYAYTNPGRSQYVLEWSARTNRIFSGYVSGSILDSLIIGVLTFIVLNILNIEYAIIISVLVGVTNVIPFFGPFIGAIPSAFLLLLVSPQQCLIFIIVILVIQQLDGNVIKPHILGNSTGLSSFWVVFAVIVSGGLFGFLGMFIGVPVFAVIYSLFKAIVEGRLNKKGLSVETEDYRVENPDSFPQPKRKQWFKSRRKKQSDEQVQAHPNSDSEAQNHRQDMSENSQAVSPEDKTEKAE